MEDAKPTTSSAEVAAPPSRCPRQIPKRYVLAILCNLAFFFRGFVVANNMLIIVKYLGYDMGSEEINTDESNLSQSTIEELGNIAYSYYWVTAIGQIPAAILVFTYSPQKIMMISMIGSSLLQLITPWTITKSITGVVINVVCQALCLCPFDCACIGLLRHWAPSTERTRLLMLAFSGRYAHIQIAFLISPYLASSFGPNSIYYFTGVSGAVWCILWCAFIKDSPPEEQLPNSESEENKPCKLKTLPLKSMAKSLPLLCLCLVFACPVISYRILMQYLSFHYVKNVENLGEWILTLNWILFIPISGFIIDRLINGKKFKTMTIRKVLCSGGLMLHVLFVMLHKIDHDVTSPLCFYVAFLIMDVVAAGIIPNILDLSHQYAIPLMGLAMTVMTTCSLLSDYIHPIIFSESLVIPQTTILNQLPMCLFALIAALLFAIFGSAEEQPWSTKSLPIQDLQEDIEKNSKNEFEEQECTTKDL